MDAERQQTFRPKPKFHSNACWDRCPFKSYLLAISLALNLWMFWTFREALSTSLARTWSKAKGQTAEVAELEASRGCSGHAYGFQDFFIAHNQTCPSEGNDCISGSHCYEYLPSCQADANSGDPAFLEPFWLRNAEMSTTLVAGWYGMSYFRRESNSWNSLSLDLEFLIRKLHGLVQNAVTDGRFIVVGVGAMQLINAAVYSLSRDSREINDNPALVVAAAPFYNDYKSQTEIFASVHYKWAGDARLWASRIKTEGNSARRFVEIVASPNNPDGAFQKGVLQGEAVKHISDRAYYWPHYTPITEAANDDVMLFSISKLTGHAGSRLGWAIVKEKAIYERMIDYVLRNTLGVSIDTQLRTITLLKSIVESYEKAEMDSSSEKLIFEYAFGVMKSRWEILEKVFAGSERFSLQHKHSAFCNFLGRVRAQSPAYAWVKCERAEDEDCAQVMEKAGGILGRNGVVFGWSKRFVRLSVIQRHSSFQILVHRLRTLVGSAKKATDDRRT